MRFYIEIPVFAVIIQNEKKLSSRCIYGRPVIMDHCFFKGTVRSADIVRRDDLIFTEIFCQLTVKIIERLWGIMFRLCSETVDRSVFRLKGNENRGMAGSVEYYNKATKDAILYIPTPPLSSTEMMYRNAEGKIVNKGFEFSIGSEIIRNKDFTWNFDVNGATVKNEVKGLPVSGIYSGEISGPGFSGVTANISETGMKPDLSICGFELYWEMYRRKAMIRFGKFDLAGTAKPASQPYRRIFPIPQTALDASKDFSQNPGY